MILDWFRGGETAGPRVRSGARMPPGVAVEENLRRGMTADGARRAAKVRLGGATQLREVRYTQPAA